MTQNILTFEKYGRRPIHKRIVSTLKDRFRINPHTNTLLIERGLTPYVPKLNMGRVALSVVGVVVCVVVPLITPLSIPIFLWGLK